MIQPQYVLRPTNLKLIIQIPCLNERDQLGATFSDLPREVPGIDEIEVLVVDDGSTDGTLDTLQALRRQHNEIRVIDFSRNFGKEAALTAGLDYCRGRAVIPIDVDLQDPPEVIESFIVQWKQGYDVLYATREKRSGDNIIKRIKARIFYRIFNLTSDTKIPNDTGDFRLMDRKVVDALRSVRERNRFMKGLFAWVGFR